MLPSNEFSVKVWCYFGANGRICADSEFRSAEDAWRTMLGWSTVGEVREAQARGDRVVQIEISEAVKMNELIAFDGYIAEVGDLGMGMRGGKPGKGVLLELDGRTVEFRGLSSLECRALAKNLRSRVMLRIVLIDESS